MTTSKPGLIPQETIRKAKLGQAIPATELQAFLSAYLEGGVADYQVAAWLMAVCLKGMGREETRALTAIMRDSGEVLSWSHPRHLIVDKHSTGGVGDKTSLIILPLAILEGLKVPMMAGRGLGHTGGTLDKVQVLGLKVHASPEDARRQIDTLGGVLLGQTERMAPLDRRLYALRDVTATVESIPLIVASILSKKLAEGIGALVMDVKFGSGAFMSDQHQALALAEELTAVGKLLGLRVTATLSDMGSPLGRAAGNALEIHECIEVLSDKGPHDCRELSLELTTDMVLSARPSENRADVRKRLEGYLASGQAMQTFERLVVAQGGDPSWLHQPQRLLQGAKIVQGVDATGPSGRYVKAIDVRALGLSIVQLGGGRRQVHDSVDPWVGLSSMKHVGEKLAPGEPLAVVHAHSQQQADAAIDAVRAAYQLSDEPCQRPPLIWTKIGDLSRA